MATSFHDRQFQLWEYKVSHGSLLIRSPQDAEHKSNIDLICVGVEYIAAPGLMRGLELVEPTAEETQHLSWLLGEEINPSSVRIIVSEGRRFPIVAASFKLAETNCDIFDSPF